jgi:hypothetical protein
MIYIIIIYILYTIHTGVALLYPGTVFTVPGKNILVTVFISVRYCTVALP